MPNRPSRPLSFVCLPLLVILTGAAGSLYAGPYSAGTHDSNNAFDAPVPGFVGPDGDGVFSTPTDDGVETHEYYTSVNYVNPLFLGWASSVVSYDPAVKSGFTPYPEANILGPVTGNVADIVTLGEPTIVSGEPLPEPGSVTISFDRAICDLTGADFVVFENGFEKYDYSGDTFTGLVTAELAYVEVSTDGVNWARFPSDSLTESAVGAYGTIDPTNVYNLAGKHVNAFGDVGNASWGTPFDLSALVNEANVINGLVELDNILFVRIVDVPGSGDYLDADGDPIYDGYPSLFGANGADIEAVGQINIASDFSYWRSFFTLNAELSSSDGDGDRIPLLLEYAFGLDPQHHDKEPPYKLESVDGLPVFVFRRDVRAHDLTYIVKTSPSLTDPEWTEIARSEAGGTTTTSLPLEYNVSEASASHINSVQSLVEVRLSLLANLSSDESRYFQVEVVSAP